MSAKGVVTTTGSAFVKFLNDEAYWGGADNETYFDDSIIFVDGQNYDDHEGEVPATATVEISGGYIYDHPTKKDGLLLTTFFKNWLKQQSFVTKLVEVPKDREDEFMALLKANGFM